MLAILDSAQQVARLESKKKNKINKPFLLRP